jgi:tetratricopeptide (TPR) repeat protein
MSISVARLRPNPPVKALRFFARGSKLASAGKWLSAAREFGRAIALDPNFSEAYGNRGAVYSALGLFDQAVDDLRRAIELDPATGTYHLNLAYVLIRLNRPAEAEPEAQTAVSLDPGRPIAHYLLGVLLFAQHPETRTSAIQHLAYAAREFPDAHFILAQIYFTEGRDSAGRLELEQFQKEMITTSVSKATH